MPTAPITDIAAEITRDEAAKTTSYNLKIPFAAILGNPVPELATERIGISIMLNESDGPDESDGSRGTFEVVSGHLKSSDLFTVLYLLSTGEYKERLEAAATAAVANAVSSESAADIAAARNFVAIMADGDVKEELENRLEAIGVSTTYTVTFKDWDGTVLKTETVKQGDPATAPALPSRVGYTFTGWSVAFTEVRANLTVMAEYDAVPGNPDNPDNPGNQGSVWTPPSPVVSVDSGGNVTVSSMPTMNGSSHIAQTTLSKSELEQAFDRATGHSKRIKVKLSSLEQAKGYALGLPASWFKGDSSSTVVIETPVGTVVVTSAMLNAVQLQEA